MPSVRNAALALALTFEADPLFIKKIVRGHSYLLRSLTQQRVREEGYAGSGLAFQADHVEIILNFIYPADRGLLACDGQRRFEDDLVAQGMGGEHIGFHARVADVDRYRLVDPFEHRGIHDIFDGRREIKARGASSFDFPFGHVVHGALQRAFSFSTTGQY